MPPIFPGFSGTCLRLQAPARLGFFMRGPYRRRPFVAAFLSVFTWLMHTIHKTGFRRPSIIIERDAWDRRSRVIEIFWPASPATSTRCMA